MKTSSVEFISRSPNPLPMKSNYRRFSSGLHGNTAADSVRSGWPLWHAAKSNAVFARRRIELKQELKLLDIRAEKKERSRERERERKFKGSHCKPSYANVLAPSGVTENKGKSSDYCVVVDSDNCSSEDVKKIIKAKINPAESKLGVCDLKNIRGNKLLVKCVSENDRDRLLTEIQEKSPELKASVPKRRNPAIIVKNVPDEVKNEDLLKKRLLNKILKLFVDDESIRQCRVRFTLKPFNIQGMLLSKLTPTVSKSILHKQD
ncbi:hypothetical protein TNCV_3404231 [Trichonephila clavipes]|nr:hypothetical protein TNCV_3404231 [Trichonephila clavipes]